MLNYNFNCNIDLFTYNLSKNHHSKYDHGIYFLLFLVYYTMQNSVWPKGGIYPVLWDFWPKRGSDFLRWGCVGLILKGGDFEEFHKK